MTSMDLGDSVFIVDNSTSIPLDLSQMTSLDSSSENLILEFSWLMDNVGVQANIDKIPKKSIEKVIPLLKEISAFFLDVLPSHQTETPIRIHLSHFKENGFATPDDPDFEVVHTEDFEEFRINLQHYSRSDQGLVELRQLLNSEKDRIGTQREYKNEIVFFDSNFIEVNETALARFTADGYAAHEATRLKLGQTAKDPGFVSRSAEEFILACTKANIDNPVFLEIGAFGANGIPELIKELEKYIQMHPVIKRSRIVLVDALESSIENGKVALKNFQIPESLNGLSIEFIHLKDLSPAAIKKVYDENKISGNVLTARLVNVLEAIDSPQIKMVDGKKYRVLGKAGISYPKLASLLLKHFKDLDFTIENLVVLIQESLEQTKTPIPIHFIDEFSKRNGCTSRTAGKVYNSLLKSFRIYHNYRKLEEGEKLNWPGNEKFLWNLLREHNYGDHFPHMGPSLSALESTSRVLHPHGVILANQLATDIERMRSLRRGHITITPARAYYVPVELLTLFGKDVLRLDVSQIDKSISGGKFTGQVNKCFRFENLA